MLLDSRDNFMLGNQHHLFLKSQTLILQNQNQYLPQRNMDSEITQEKLNAQNKENVPNSKPVHSLSQIEQAKQFENDQLSSVDNRKNHKRYSLSKEANLHSKMNNRKFLIKLKQNKAQQSVKSSKLSSNSEEQSYSSTQKGEESPKQQFHARDIMSLKKVIIRNRFNNKIPLPIKQKIRRNSTELYLEAEDLRHTKKSQFKEEGILCNICANDYLESQIVIFGKCEHQFCKNCLLEYLKYKIKSYQEPLCPEQNCEETLDENLLIFTEMEELLKQQYQRNKKNFKVLSDSTLKFCPNPSCINQFIQQLQNSNNVQCSNCQILYCFKCLYPAHKQSECDLSDLRYLQRNLKYRQCFNCKRVIEKNQGCNHIVCLCKYEFCYECGQKWTGNDHLCIESREEEEQQENLSTGQRIAKIFLKIFVIIPVWLIITVLLVISWVIGAIGLFILLILSSVVAPAGISDNCCIYFLILLVFPYALYLGYIFLFKQTCGPAYIQLLFTSRWNQYRYFTTRYLCR